MCTGQLLQQKLAECAVGGIEQYRVLLRQGMMEDRLTVLPGHAAVVETFSPFLLKLLPRDGDTRRVGEQDVGMTERPSGKRIVLEDGLQVGGQRTFTVRGIVPAVECRFPRFVMECKGEPFGTDAQAEAVLFRQVVVKKVVCHVAGYMVY